jgi:alkylation response protein AidB-like acyl-CoA dehydrogenase
MADPSRLAGASFLVHAPSPHDTVIPDDLGEEERMLVAAVEDFAEQEVAPRMDAVTAGDHQVKRELFEKAAELGFFMAEVPEEMGGLDLNVLAITGMCSSNADLAGVGSMIYGHQGIGMLPIVNFGTPQQVEQYLVPCMEGGMVSAFALTEPGTGSDAMNIETQAVLNGAGTHYVVNGAKQWITNASLAHGRRGHR